MYDETKYKSNFFPPIVVALETDPSAVFFPVSKLSHYRTVIAVTIKVGLEYIQIMTVSTLLFLPRSI